MKLVRGLHLKVMERMRRLHQVQTPHPLNHQVQPPHPLHHQHQMQTRHPIHHQVLVIVMKVVIAALTEKMLSSIML
jgi:hypothetical protein